MAKKNLLIFIALIILLIVSALLFDVIQQSSKRQLLDPASADAYSAVAIDMDLDEALVSTKDIMTGQDPLLVIVNTNHSSGTLQSIQVIRTLAELTKLNQSPSKTINQFDPIYQTLALAYLPKSKSFSFFSRKTEKIHLVPLKTAGVRGLLFDEEWNWVKEQDVSHPNFANTIIFALMADNSKRPVAEVKVPFNIIREIQDPAKSSFGP